MDYLSEITVIAYVRHGGATSDHYPARAFDLMLDQRQPQDAQLKEAARILRQLGYEPRSVRFACNPGN